MNANDKLNLVFKRIKLLDAPEQQIDLDDPAHRLRSGLVALSTDSSTAAADRTSNPHGCLLPSVCI
jgi:hypothetical protein